MKTTRRLFLLVLAFVMAFTIQGAAEYAFVNPNLVKSMFELTFSAIDCNYDIHGNSAGYIVRFSSEDYSFMYIMAQLFGNEDTDKLMAEVAQSTTKLCSDMREAIASLGVNKPNLTLILTDNTEKDYIFLIVCNDQVVYDILAK